MRGVAVPGARTGLLAGLIVMAAVGAQAQEAGSWRLQGFGGWAFGKTDNDNTYAYIANGEGHYNNYDFALNLAAHPTEAIALRSQVFFGEDLGGRTTDVDYVFAEWTHSPRLRARAGKVLIPFGLYTEIYDVGTLRPFYLLPQFYSGSSGLMPKSYLGAGVTGVIPMGETWEVGYDVFAGEVHFQPFPSSVTVGIDAGTGTPIIRDMTVELIGRNMIGGRILVGAPSKGLQAGAGLLRADMEQRIDDGPRTPFPVAEDAELAQLQLQYVLKGLTLRSEYFHAFADTSTLHAFYAEASYKITKRWQVAGLYENTGLEPKAGSLYERLPQNMRNHEAFGLGLSFWLSPELVVKLDGYAVDGNFATRSATTLLDSMQGRAETTTGVVVAGVQFAF